MYIVNRSINSGIANSSAIEQSVNVLEEKKMYIQIKNPTIEPRKPPYFLEKI